MNTVELYRIVSAVNQLEIELFRHVGVCRAGRAYVVHSRTFVSSTFKAPHNFGITLYKISGRKECFHATDSAIFFNRRNGRV